TSDSLAGFSLDEKTGVMKSIGIFPTAHFPRSFCISLSGKYVYSVGQKSSTLFAYKLDPTTGQLGHLFTIDVGKTPSWAMCGKISD
ncbi:MAG: lactonase family protein, partial [Planctomycetes bacterium]|nr:lactonase family protein [Planctomycetota bacterium]